MLTLLRNAQVYAPEPLGTVDVLVGAERILAVGPRLDGIGRLGEEHDLAGAFVGPGLVDPHVHLTGGGGEGGPSTRVGPLDPAALAAAGVTTAVGVLGTDAVTRHPADLLAAARAIQATGLSASMWTGSYALPPVTLTGDVRRDLVVVPEVRGVGEVAISDARGSQPTLDELARLAADCHVGGLLAGKRGRLHLHVGGAPGGLGPVAALLDRGCVPPGVLYPTHVNRSQALWAEARRLAGRGVVVDVTASGTHDDVSAARAVHDWLRDGLPPGGLTVSTDAGGSLPVFGPDGALVRMDVGAPSALPDALRRLVTGGHAPEVVLPFFATNAADHLGLARKGRVRAGFDADLVVFDADWRVRDVLARGRWVVRGGRVDLGGRP